VDGMEVDAGSDGDVGRIGDFFMPVLSNFHQVGPGC
jgi:hypothetical protein